MDSNSVNSSSSVSSLNGDESHRVKFLCSFLGSILPRPQDGKLRYVGGETRIVSVSRDIRYDELISKMRELYDNVTTLKYQQPDEDLDALVSVVNDDDVTNMMEEYDKLVSSGDGFTRLRVFLFSSSPEYEHDGGGSLHYVEQQHDSGHRVESERRYVDALNNLIEGTKFPDSPRFDDFPLEPMLSQLSIDRSNNEIPLSQYNDLRQLRIPRVGSGQMIAQRYGGEVEGGGTWSPYYSPRHHGHYEFQSSPSYRMPYGEVVVPESQHLPLYEHQQPQVHDNVGWESKGGFPGNVFHGGYEGGGGNTCDNCRGTIHRNHQQPFEQQPNNGFPPPHCAHCPPPNMLNSEPKPPTPHGGYLNEAFGHERGWMVQQQQVGRPSYHYTPDGPGMNYRLGHRTGPEITNEVFHDKPIYTPNIYTSGLPDNIHTASHSSHIQQPQQNIWQHNVPNHIAVGGAPGLPPLRVNGTANQSNQSFLVGSPGFDGQPYLPNPLHDRAFPLDPNWVPSVVHNEYTPQGIKPLSGTTLSPITQTLDCQVERPVDDGVPSLDKTPSPIAQGLGDMGNLVEVSPAEGEELSVERLSFLPELMESVKRAALEGAAEVKAHPEEETNNPARTELESEHVNAQVEAAEMDSDNDNPNNFKIEPTEAEAKALSRGLQTIRNDDLEEIRELGCGTYGSVYHGKWKGSDVAIKRIKASCFAGKPTERQRLIEDFWKEALTLSSLHHPNVVAFYGIVRDGPDGSLATVAEFMVNGSLKQFLQKKDRTIDRRKRLIIAMDTAFGMEYLHGKNIVHFDLKCENLLVNMRDPQRPVCKIGDLGLSKVRQKTLVSGGVRGTLPWMAPELLSGKSNMVSEKIDVYSFGIVMWELLTGEEPYKDMHCASIIGGIVNSTLRPKVPQWCDPEWKGLMESCWTSEPTERPSFAEISQKLRTMAAAMNLK